MNDRFKKRLVLSGALLVSSIAAACSTPVFRYAVERWEPDPYTLIFFTEGELSTGQKAVADGLIEYEKLGFMHPPFYLKAVDVTSTNNPYPEFWAAASSNRPAPCVALVAPERIGTGVIWTDELSSNAVNRIVMSPARAEIAKRILGGDAAVWVLIPGTDPEKTRAARELLGRVLPEIEKNTQFNPDFLSEVAAAGDEPPKLHFSVLEVSRSDPREAVLLSMLPRLAPEMKTDTLLIPVFGQGRAAFIMGSDFIKEEHLQQVATFLTGSCSCEVKSMNPGFDLLIPADWINGIKKEYVYDAITPSLVSFAGMTSSVPAPEPEPAVAPEVSVVAPAGPKLDSRLFDGVLVVFMLSIIGVLGITTWLLIRKNKKHESD